MTSYTCTIRFTDASRTSVVADYNPAAPALGFDRGDDITFTSADGPWHAMYPESPFHNHPRSVIISGKAGEQIRMYVNATRTGAHPFRCLIDVNAQPVGWSDDGGDTHIKTT